MEQSDRIPMYRDKAYRMVSRLFVTLRVTEPPAPDVEFRLAGTKYRLIETSSS
jgi:hypothetical protein